jgi:hypothetical protein
MSIILLIGFNLFVSSSVPQGSVSIDTPSGFSIMVGGKYKINYDLIASYYSKTNYEVRLHGIATGKEFFLGKSFTIFPEIGIIRGKKMREGASESGYSPVCLVRFAYLFPAENPSFQLGFSIREVFNGKMGVDFLDIGIGFRM